MCACSWRYRHIHFFRKNISIRWRNMCFNGVIWTWRTQNSAQSDVIETHIPPSDRNIFSKKKYVAISPWAGAHVGERNLLLSSIRRSYRQNNAILCGILGSSGPKWRHWNTYSSIGSKYFFSKKSTGRYAISPSPWAGAHVGERNLLLSAIWRSYRQKCFERHGLTGRLPKAGTYQNPIIPS